MTTCRKTFTFRGPPALHAILDRADELVKEHGVSRACVPAGRWKGFRSDFLLRCVVVAGEDVLHDIEERGVKVLADVDRDIVGIAEDGRA